MYVGCQHQRLGRVIINRYRILAQHAGLALVLSYGLAITLTHAGSTSDLTEIERAKSDVLQLDRELSRLEHEISYPKRTLVLFGLSPKSKATINQLDVVIDGQALPTKYFSYLELNSMKMGGMVSIYDDNFNLGKHQIDVKMQDASTRQQYTQTFNIQKSKAKNIIGIRYIERPAPKTSPIKLVEWPLND